MWDGQASIHSPLQDAEHLVACGGSGEPSIQVAGESARLTINALHVELVARHLHLAFVHLVQAKLVQQLRTENCNMWLSGRRLLFRLQKFSYAYHVLIFCGQLFDFTITAEISS